MGVQKRGFISAQPQQVVMELCALCGKNPIALTGRTKTGKLRFGKTCEPCKRLAKSIRLNGNRAYILSHKKSYCEECGFVAVDKCQLDVDHIDGNRLNSSPENLRTMCSNCHRLKTKLNRDHVMYGKNHVSLVDQGDLLDMGAF